MEAIIASLIAFILIGDIAEKVTPWVTDRVEQYYDVKEQDMTWVLVALFIFNGEPMVMSDNILYETEEQCSYAASKRREYLEATRPESMWEADYWVWCTQIPKEV